MAEPRAIVPEKGIRPGYNGTGSDLAKYVAVAVTAAGQDDPTEIELPAAGGKIYGVVVSSKVRVDTIPDVGIPDGEVGDIQVEGRVPMLVGTGGVAVGNAVAVDAAGAAVVAASGNIVIGEAVTAAAATEFAEIELVGAAQSRIVP